MPRKTHVYLAAAVTAAALLAGACGRNSASTTGTGDAAGKAQARPVVKPGASASGPATGSGRASSPAGPKPAASPSAAPAIDPGTLPQTTALPGDRDAQFQAGAQDLWQAIVQDKPELARPFFFPLSAYQQVKAIWNPAEDYQDRLMAWYGLDIQAAHDHLGSAADARFVGVDVPEENAEWIEPGVEYNKGSYYRVYGSRLNYQVSGHDASIGVFSLISWRGEWYVVHLGPSTRSAMEGIVYDPWN
jgi:hypothetical protein